MRNTGPVDFVITWVDGNDPKWKKAKKSHSKAIDSKSDASDERYRDFGYLKYWFRSIEKNAPWVNKIHFVTYGHIPEWLDVNHSKINIVKHEDFIDNKCLPTFNSCAIEVNMDQIPGLSEKFVYFNDDMYINKPVGVELFFAGDRPKSTYVVKTIGKTKTHASRININCNSIINKFKNNRKEFSVGNGLLMTASNIRSVFEKGIKGYSSKHAPAAFLKSSYSQVRVEIPDIINSTTASRFRQEDNVSQWIFEYWQMATGISKPRSYKCSKYYAVSHDCREIINDIKRRKHSLICINDDSNSNKQLVLDCNERIIKAFAERYPNKSEFEK